MQKIRLNILGLFLCILGILGGLCQSVYAQNNCDSITLSTEAKIVSLLQSISVRQPEEVNLKKNKEIEASIEHLLRQPCAFSKEFNELKKVMSIINAPDETFRIFNWSLIHADGTYTYFAYIQQKQDNEFYKTFKLIDISDSIPKPEFASLDRKHWYGCLYYDIIKTSAGNKDYYTLLGWDGKDLFTNVKIIEVLQFSRVGEPTFGKNIFKGSEPKIKRVLLEYSQKSSMTLRYNQRKKMIIFDHLSPSKSLYSGHYDYYGADFTFDAYEFIDGKWLYRPDVDIRNAKPPKKKGNTSNR